MVGNKRRIDAKNVFWTGLMMVVLGGAPIFWKFFEMDWKVGLAVIVLWLVAQRNKYFLVLVMPIVFLINLNINHFFTINLRPFEYSFNLEKMVITNPGNLEVVETYWKNDVVVPYRVRNIFYGDWLVLRLWVMNILKIMSPVYLVRTIGFLGFGMLFLTKPKKEEFFWIATVVVSSALGILVDSNMSLVGALPALIFWWQRGIRHEK